MYDSFINGVYISGFEDYDTSRLFNYLILKNRIISKSWIRKKMSILTLLKSLVIKRAEFCYNRGRDNKILYFDHELNRRSDISEMIHKVCQTFDNKCDSLTWQKKERFILHRFCKNIILLFKWNKDLKRSSFKFSEKMSVLALLLEFTDTINDIKDIVNFSQYKLAFCFYDAESFQNLLIQYSKHKGCKTATLQHGIMLAARSSIINNIDYAGMEFSSFVSDYFLVWNEFTKKEALKAHICESKIVVTGIAKCIGEKTIKKKENGIIGILLDGIYEQENNEPMIRIVQDYAKRNGLRCLIRFHPYFKGNEYDILIDDKISKKCDSHSTLISFLEQIEFCVLSNSTALFELEYYQVPFIRYSSNGEKDKYRDYSSISFCKDESIVSAVFEMRCNDNNISIGDVAANYRAFFKSFN